MTSLQHLNTLDQAGFTALLSGIYEHSPWIAEQAWSSRPFQSLAQLKRALVQVVRASPASQQVALIRAHPELAGLAMVANTMTAESTSEQSGAGLAHCTPQEFVLIRQLNDDYRNKFGWPFVLAVRGPRGLGLSRGDIIATLQRRLQNPADFEQTECLRQIHRIAELRLNDKLKVVLTMGHQVWDWSESLAQHSDPGFKENGQLTVTYLTAAHQACAQQLQAWMASCGFDEVGRDAVGNVVGLYHGSHRGARRLLTGSHYDTVRNGGKYDGRLGILVPMACVQALHQAGRRLPFGFEVVAFAEEEGQRYKATFLGSGALIGQFNPDWLEQLDADGVSMRQAMLQAQLPGDLQTIATLRRDPAHYLGFVELHIEQGPVLNELDLPLGVVTSINGSVRFLGEAVGVACHAGTTPMNRRHDAAAAVAELALYAESRALADGDSVATVGILQVPCGSINVVPGRCQFSLDVRAPNDAQRDRLWADIQSRCQAIAARRGVTITLEETMRVSAAPSDAAWQRRWEAAVLSTGLPVYRLPSGAGHDAMKLHELLPQAMLFVRGGNAGISHNPLESINSDDAQLCVEAFSYLLEKTALEFP